MPAHADPLAGADPGLAAPRAAAGSPAGSASAAGAAVGIGLTFLAARRIGFDSVVESAVRSDFAWVLIATAFMCLSMFFRAGAWFQAARAALPVATLRRRDFTSATMIGVLMSATLPARLGEPARAMIIARRIGRFRETFPVLLGTLVTQTVFNIVALILLGVVIVASTDLFHRSSEHLFLVSFAPALLLIAVVAAPALVRRNGSGRVARLGAMPATRSSASAPASPSSATRAAGAAGRARCELVAWAIQVPACYALAGSRWASTAAMGIGGAAAVLFAVNVTAVVPATPSNIGVFQLAVISVLATGYGVGAADALAYGVILQAVEIATAVGARPPGARPRGDELVRRPPAGSERLPGAPAAESRESTSRSARRLGRRAGRRCWRRHRPSERGPAGSRESTSGLSFLSHPERLRDPDRRKPPQPAQLPERRGTVRQPGSMEVTSR